MSSEWQTVPLGQLLTPGRSISYGIVQPGFPVDDGVPIVRVNDVRNGRISSSSPMRVSPQIESAYSRTRLEGGELLLTLVGTIGETAVVPDSLRGWNTARAVGVIPIRSDIGAYWIRLALQSPQARHIIDSLLNTTVQATLNLGGVAQLPIILPPYEEREKIAHILGTLDDKIELNRKVNETLEAMARALFKSWFVDFDPVHAKAEGRHPGLPRYLADLFPSSFEGTEQGEIPVGWRVGAFGEIAANPRRSVAPGKIDPSGPYIALEHMPRCSIALQEWSAAGVLESNKFEFKRGEILFGKLRPYFHKVGVAPLDGVCSTDIVVLAPADEGWFGLVLGIASSAEFVEYTNAGSTGTKMPRTSWTDMARYQIALPPESLARAFDTIVRPLVDRLIGSIHESHAIMTLRDTLLPKLISGELRVKGTERLVERML